MEQPEAQAEAVKELAEGGQTEEGALGPGKVWQAAKALQSLEKRVYKGFTVVVLRHVGKGNVYKGFTLVFTVTKRKAGEFAPPQVVNFDTGLALTTTP